MTLSIDKAVIEHIVREVIQSLQAAKSELVYRKSKLLIVYDENREQDEVKQIAAALEAGWHVIRMPFRSPDLVSAISDIKHVVMLDVNQDILVRGALGFIGSAPNELLAAVLHNGIPVTLVLTHSLEWILRPEGTDDDLPEPARRYRQHIRKHKDILASFGAAFAGLSDLQIAPIGGDRTDHDNTQSGKTLYFEQKVLTQEDVRVSDVGTIVVSRSTLVTPLARDTARDKGVTILVQES
ncbi:hypothetical protein [Paenibacillus thalictri]|uniref:Uncharacterized protein n=1 Tax=Paenibacillus thalictri TaxID=2527873 RepID=A0A4Q9DNK0_9BACL|nr:hypothetical protein [Paenibacillus thalictri]TBL76479.1 hypothetical protein EYB31_18765 [Paenibacillus thalictri]